MKLDEHFLAKEEHTANREYLCCLDLLKIIKLKLEQGNFYGAEQRIMDLTVSNHELKMMKDKKLNDSTSNLVNLLQQRGESNEVLRRLMQEV